jgi:hypothetical protein
VLRLCWHVQGLTPTVLRVLDMPVTVKVNGVANSLVHKGSNGISIATIPDVCKTPSPAGPVPIPYPNISQSMTLDKGSTTVKADGGMMIATKGSEFSLSNGDNAGVAGGVKSSTFMKESTWILYSFDVKIDGQNACRLTDKKFQNHENTADLGGTCQPPVSVVELAGCEAATKAADEAIKLVGDLQKALNSPFVVAGGHFIPASGSSSSLRSASLISAKQVIPGGKYRRFARGVSQPKAGKESNSNVICGGKNHVYPRSACAKEGHAEAKMIEDIFAKRIPPFASGAGPSPVGGTLCLSVKNLPVCCSCQALIRCAQEAGLKVVLCPPSTEDECE